jgi:hypothetical protein
MSLNQLFASIRANRRLRQQHAEEEGLAMLRRLQELRDVTEPTPVETPLAQAQTENRPEPTP